MLPWEIAVKSFRTEAESIVDVEHATDAEFQQFVVRAGIPIDDSGIAEWSFDDRCGVVNHALKFGVSLPWLTENNSETIRNGELFIVPTSAQGAQS